MWTVDLSCLFTQKNIQNIDLYRYVKFSQCLQWYHALSGTVPGSLNLCLLLRGFSFKLKQSEFDNFGKVPKESGKWTRKNQICSRKLKHQVSSFDTKMHGWVSKMQKFIVQNR
jgi:hypothetical protein